jgi:hypothetical protein
MKKVLITMLALLTAGPVFAAKQRVDSDTWKSVGSTGTYYGRTDGLFHEVNSKGLAVIENGDPASWPGVGYRETFAYGAGLGLTCLDMAGGTCVGDTTTVPSVLTFGSGVKLVHFPVVTATIPMVTDATSLDIGGDQVADDGSELVGGVLGATGRPFVVGDDEDFYFCATLAVADVSGTDDLHVGFREAEPMNAVFDDYTDLASIGLISGDIYIETIAANAATTSTDTTDNWADAAVKKLCVYVSDAGVVTYKIDGIAPTTTAAYTLADGLPVIPFIHYIHDTDLAGEIDLTLWEVGYSD